MWRVAASSLSYLNRASEHLRLRFSAAVTGNTRLPPRWMKCVTTTTSSLPNAVGAMYVHQYFNGRSKQEAMEMVGEIRIQFESLLRDVNWMDDKTKLRAIDKARSMVTHIGYPTELEDINKLNSLYSGLDLVPNDYYGNALRTTLYSTNYAFSKLRQPVDKQDWVRHGRPAVVNAFYSPLENSIQFPAGILQGIFFNSERPKYLNYGAVGWVIGHEITHGFDDQGRQFDKNGDLVDWWEQETKDEFVTRTQCMVSQYNNYTVSLPGVSMGVNGVTTQVTTSPGVRCGACAYHTFVAPINQKIIQT